MADFLLLGSDLASLVEVAATFVAYGFGLGCAVFLLALGFWLVVQFVRF